MSCYHPNKAFIVGYKPDGKTKNVKFASASVEFVYSNDPTFAQCAKRCEELPASIRSRLVRYDSFLWVDYVNPKYPVYYCLDFVRIPCGKCQGCKVDRSKEWANRMVMEASYYDSNCFVTLTYDQDHLPMSKYKADADDREREFNTLRKKDLQDFFKRLRKHVSVLDPHTGKVLDYSKIRYFACGEYGTETLRPHYHAIIFNWIPDDLVYHSHDKRGYNLYISETLARIWENGFVYVGFVNWETCAYVARYVTKKIDNGFKNFYKFFHIEPEFSVMSRKPGIAKSYFEDYKDDIYKGDVTPIIRLSAIDRSLRFNPPRYFDKLLDMENHELLDSVKSKKVLKAENIVDLKLSETDLDYYEMLAVEEQAFIDRVKSLKRL